MAKASKFLMRGLLHGFYWCDDSLQCLIGAAGFPPLSRIQSMIMVKISDGITRPSDLARNIGISRQAIQQTLAEMERNGLVSLVVDPDDGRAKVVRFSRRGRGIGQRTMKALAEIETELGRRLGRDTVRQLKQMLFTDWEPVLNKGSQSAEEPVRSRRVRRRKA